jgi:hypothetical protein
MDCLLVVFFLSIVIDVETLVAKGIVSLFERSLFLGIKVDERPIDTFLDSSFRSDSFGN